MLKHMLLGLGAASLLVVTAMPVQAVPIPLPETAIVTRGDWQWVWVSPCTERNDKQCSFVEDEVVERYGFGPPVITTTSNPWVESFGATNGHTELFYAFVDPANPIGNCAYNSFSGDFFGEPCNTGDLQQGIVWDSPYLSGIGTRLIFTADVVWVKWIGSVPESLPSGSLPEPSSLLLLGAGLLGLAAWRWKHAA